MAITPVKKAPAKKKSGIRTFKQGEILFKENDPAQSLYIIQKGQIRLYRPKGRGFVDLAILRSGEVIGEMAYFDEKTTRRSCSAEAMVTTEVIEISFKAFEKTMAGLNPWFKTIINTLANRLRKTNEKVKNLESNSIGFAKNGQIGDYVFFHSIDAIRILSLLHLTFASMGEVKGDYTQILMSKLNFYMDELFNIPEVKLVEFFKMLEEESYIKIELDEKERPKYMQCKNVESFRSMMAFLNSQRQLEDEKKLTLSPRCLIFLRAILDQLDLRGAEKEVEVADISAILDNFREKKLPVTDEDLVDAVQQGLCGDIIVGGQNKLTCTVQYLKIKKLYPAVKMSNAIKRINESKSNH